MAGDSSQKLEDAKLNPYETYKLGNFKLRSGGEIPDAFIAYKTLGKPSLPAIIYPTWYSGCWYTFSLSQELAVNTKFSDR